MVYKKLLDVGKKIAKKLADRKAAKVEEKKLNDYLDKHLFGKDGSLKMDPTELFRGMVDKDRSKIKDMGNFYSDSLKDAVDKTQKRTLNFKGGLMKKPKLAKKGY
jgi:sialic acid synthase SpsE